MSYVKALNSALHRLLVTQLVLMLGCALAGLLIGGLSLGTALVYGGGIAVVNTLLQQWHATRAERVAGISPERNMRLLYRCAIERFFATVVLFSIGLGSLNLAPLPLLLGFIIAQLAQIFRWISESGLRRRHV
jgi:ATP synthase protein I